MPTIDTNTTTLRTVPRWWTARIVASEKIVLPILVGLLVAVAAFAEGLAASWVLGSTPQSPHRWSDVSSVVRALIIGAASVPVIAWALQRVRTVSTVQLKQFDELLDATPAGVIGVDGEGQIVLVNGAAALMFGYRREDLIGELVETLVPAPARGAQVAHRRTYYESPDQRTRGTNVTVKACRRNGSQFPAEMSLNSLSTHRGTITLALVRDVSEQRALVNELIDAKRRLEQELRERQGVTTELQVLREMSELLQASKTQEETREVLMSRWHGSFRM